MNFKNIGLVMIYQTSKILAAFSHLQSFLLQHGFNLVICQSITEFSQQAKAMDCAIVVGGDGSMLAASTIASQTQIPLIGVHYGKLGFLTDIDPDKLNDLLSMLAGQVQAEERILLECSINDQGQYFALNEIAINRKNDAHLLSYELYVDAKLMCTQRSDGVLIHTPTGSTAYAMSAGGSIVQPLINAFGIVPLNPHRLNSRPIMVKSNQLITIKLAESASVIVSADGKKLPFENIKTVMLKQSAQKLTLLHPKSYDYFARLRQKLHWEQ